MNVRRLIARSLRFHARAHAGVVLGAAIGSAALIGALVVGDSVRGSLLSRALERLGPIHDAIISQDRFFEPSLRERLQTALRQSEIRINENAVLRGTNVPAACALMLPAVVARQDGNARANQVMMIGVESAAWPEFAGWRREDMIKNWGAGESAFINESLARQLGLRAGDGIIVRIRKPSKLGLDAAIAPKEQDSVALRLDVGAVLTAGELANFSLRAGQLPAANIFLPLNVIGQKLELTNAANLLVTGPLPGEKPLETLKPALERAWQLEDGGLTLRAIEQPATLTGGEQVRPMVELASSRIFIDATIINALSGGGPSSATSEQTNSYRVLTYLGNLLRAGERATPYSMVAASDGALIPAGMADDEMLVNEWLADDLGVKPGSLIELSYFVVDSGSKLTERTNSFRVRDIVPMRGIYADRTLMPEFPGVAKAESTHDWDLGFPLTYKIRDKDEAYWKNYRGTPKVFVTLAAGRAMWANRFGELTAIRFPVAPGKTPAAERASLYASMLQKIHPADAGLTFEPVREMAIRAVQQAQDFGGLFLGFSFFLVNAALILMALLFRFGIEQRVTEVGTLLAVGLRPKEVRNIFLAEGAALAFIGGLLGVVGGLLYARLMLWGLSTIWRGAIAGAALEYHASSLSVVTGLLASTIIAVIVIWWTLWKQAKQPARELLAGQVGSPKTSTGNKGKWVGVAAGIAAVGNVGWAVAKGETANAEIFFSAGSLLLIAGLGWAAAWMHRLGAKHKQTGFTLGDLGVRGCARRSNRSLATVALLASGAFVLLSIGVFRLDANLDASKPKSETGGFALLGQTTLPVLKDLNTREGRESTGLTAEELNKVKIIPIRVREGDDASCLNLNRAQKPRLLGVNPDLLQGRFTFSAVTKGADIAAGWSLLDRPETKSNSSNLSNEIPAIGDANSLEWALGKKIGDTLDYTDERGEVFKVRLVGAIANSILQGSLLIDEGEFVRRFPNESGYRMFLVDAPSNSVSEVSATLSRALQDVGLESVPAVKRMNELNAVQNTYLGTFQVLGGLGLLLGSGGLGVVVLRNVLERRGELAVLLAIGFRRKELLRLILSEHLALLGVGLAIALVAALVAVLPAILSPGNQLPYGSLAVTLAAVLLNGLFWTWLATRYATRGNLLMALRSE